VIDRTRHLVGSAGEGDISLAPRWEKAVQMATLEARQLDHDRVDTEHLLLALAREPEGVAARVLADLGVGYGEVLRRVSEIRDTDS